MKQLTDAALDPSGFTYVRARAAGIGRRRLYGRELQRPFRGVRSVDADLSDHIELCRAYAAQHREGHYFSHATAALIHGLPLPFAHHPSDLHVAVFAPRKPPKMRGVTSHELQAVGHRVVTVDGLPCVSPEDTWAQLSDRLDLLDLVGIGDFIITGDEPYSGQASPLGRADLVRAVRHHGRRRGVQNLRLALELVRYGSLSPQESRLRVELVNAGLPEPELNHRVLHQGRLVAMVDLAFPVQRLAIEYLGDHHRTDADLYRADVHRRERLASIGWNSVFVTAADLAGPVPRAVPLVRAALKRSSPKLFTGGRGVSRE